MLNNKGWIVIQAIQPLLVLNDAEGTVPNASQQPQPPHQDRLPWLALKQASLCPACQAQWAFRMQASVPFRPRGTAIAVTHEPSLHSSLHTPAHRARPAYGLRT